MDEELPKCGFCNSVDPVMEFNFRDGGKDFVCNKAECVKLLAEILIAAPDWGLGEHW